MDEEHGKIVMIRKNWLDDIYVRQQVIRNIKQMRSIKRSSWKMVELYFRIYKNDLVYLAYMNLSSVYTAQIVVFDCKFMNFGYYFND